LLIVRPLVGSFGVPNFPGKKPVFYGHHVVDQLRMMQMQREMVRDLSFLSYSRPILDCWLNSRFIFIYLSVWFWLYRKMLYPLHIVLSPTILNMTWP